MRVRVLVEEETGIRRRALSHRNVVTCSVPIRAAFAFPPASQRFRRAFMCIHPSLGGATTARSHPPDECARRENTALVCSQCFAGRGSTGAYEPKGCEWWKEDADTRVAPVRREAAQFAAGSAGCYARRTEISGRRRAEDWSCSQES